MSVKCTDTYMHAANTCVHAMSMTLVSTDPQMFYIQETCNIIAGCTQSYAQALSKTALVAMVNPPKMQLHLSGPKHLPALEKCPNRQERDAQD